MQPPAPYGRPAAPQPPLPAQGQVGPGWGPPPAGPVYGQPAGPPPKRRVGLMIGIIGGSTTMVLALFAGLIILVTQPDAHSVRTPASAAGLRRDPSTEKLINTETLKRNLREHANGQVTKVVSAVYAEDGRSDQVLFIGGEADSMNTDSFINDFSASAQNLQTVDDAGGLAGEGLCGELSSGVTGNSAVACVWADNDTFGQFLMLTDGRAVSDLAAIMERMRPELEKKK